MSRMPFAVANDDDNVDDDNNDQDNVDGILRVAFFICVHSFHFKSMH